MWESRSADAGHPDRWSAALGLSLMVDHGTIMCMNMHVKSGSVLRDDGISSAGLPVQRSGSVPEDSDSVAGERGRGLDASGASGEIEDEAAAAESVDVCCQCGKPTEEARKRAARERADRYLAELIEEVGGLTPEDMAEAEAWWNPVRPSRQTDGHR